MVRIFGRTGRRRNLALVAGAVTLILATALLPALAVLPGSPSKFESGNDPTLGLGNMKVDTTGNKDWVSVTAEPDYVHLQDTSSSTSDDSFTPGQKQDTTCPTTEGHKNPPKDDFTDVASFFEINTDALSPNFGDVYLYGATIRFAANGNASENIELKQGTSGFCPSSTTLLARTPNDKLLAIDYLGGGKAVEFHVLTWVATGPCFVAKDPAPCWGATVNTLDPNVAEGGVNTTAISAAENSISTPSVALVAGKFAEFGVNLSDAGVIGTAACAGFSQTIWESRSSGSSFVSSTKDVTIEDQDIQTCGSVTVTKTGDDAGSQEGAVFTLYAGSDTLGTPVGTCTVDGDGNCVNDDGTTTFPPSFTDLPAGTYTIDETTVPPGYAKDPTLPDTFEVVAGETTTVSYVDQKLEGALRILKNSSKGGSVLIAGAVFSYDTSSVTDNGTGDEDTDIGEVCVSGLGVGDYTVNETSPPTGYGASTGEGDQLVTVADGTDCGTNQPGAGATATFTNPPLSDIQVNFRDGGSGETSATITCDNATGTGSDTAATDWDTSRTVTDVEAPTTVTCTIVIDP
jgi:hypothetical protein